jgi:hypothetical protein
MGGLVTITSTIVARKRTIAIVGHQRLPSVGPGVEAGIQKSITVRHRADDAHWSLAMALAWITYRTEQAVIDIRDGRWAPTKAAIRELLSALRSGKLVAHGMFERERIPHPIETAVWSSFEIVVKWKKFAGHMSLPTSGMPVVIAQRMGPPQTRLFSTTVPAAKVRKLWPAAKRTAAAQTRCQGYLAAEMMRCLDRAPKPKPEFLTDSQARFPGLGRRGFERAWANAIRLTGAVGWAKAGRRRKTSY